MNAYLEKKKLELEKLFNFWPIYGWDWRFRNTVNFLDDPVDWVKEFFHGMRLPFGYELNTSCLMRNRVITWDIIRKQGNHFNDDPEDIK